MTSTAKCKVSVRVRCLFTLVALCLAPIHLPAYAQDAGNTPQKLLFDSPYLVKLAVPSSLEYSYQHATTEEKLYGKPFQDTIAVNIGTNKTTGGLNSVMLRVFTGERQRDLGPHLDMTGNPIIMVFLERDLWEMKRRVGGEPIFYRNLIRRALRETARVEAGEAEFGGKMVPVHKVMITPFSDEKDNRRIQKFIGKSYEFTVADAVPGGILSIRSIVPVAASGDASLIEDEIKFIKAE